MEEILGRMEGVGRLVKTENSNYLIALDKKKKVKVADFVKIGENIGVVTGISLDDPDYSMVRDNKESKILNPDYLDERVTFAEIKMISEEIESNEIGDEVILLDKDEIKMFHEDEKGVDVSYLHLFNEEFRVRILKNLKKYIDSPILDVLLADLQWNLKMQ